MTNYPQFLTDKQTPQSRPIPGRESEMVQGRAGGHVFALDKWKQLERFLILGSDAPTYHASAQELSLENSKILLQCIQEDGLQTVEIIAHVSEEGRAAKNDPAIFALAACMKRGNDETRRAANRAVSRVCRIGTHLFSLLNDLKSLGGWGSGTRRAIARWYNDMEGKKLAYQVVKYQNRNGWSHRDALRIAHPTAIDEDHQSIYRYLAKKPGDFIDHGPTSMIYAFELAKTAKSAVAIIDLIKAYGLPRECVPTEFLNTPGVWEALLEKMPVNAMIRNLGKMTSIGVLKGMSISTKHVIDKITNEEALRKSRMHPMQILVAIKTYCSGKGFKGKLEWSPVSQIIDALNDAFYLSFKNIEPSGKRFFLGVDCSGSMFGTYSGGVMGALDSATAAACMMMVTARSESQYQIGCFSDRMLDIDISARDSLSGVMTKMERMNWGGTDCSLPMIDAIRHKIEVDTFICYTDNETWCGGVHPSQALVEYRRKMGINAKLIVCAFESGGFTIADPNDMGMLDIVGFDSAAPSIIANFSRE